MQNSIVNNDFNKAINRLRKILPILSFGLLIGTYLISAIIMGILHAQNAENIGFMIAAFLVPLAIQIGRGTLVFFFQLNPARIQSRYSMGIIAATVLLILSLLEAYLVLAPYGISWIVSVCTLMGIGWIIEIMILKETVFASQIALYQNQEQWEEVKAFYIARAQLMRFVDEINQGNPDDLNVGVDSSQSQDNSSPLTNDLNLIEEGKVMGPLQNGHQKI